MGSCRSDTRGNCAALRGFEQTHASDHSVGKEAFGGNSEQGETADICILHKVGRCSQRQVSVVCSPVPSGFRTGCWLIHSCDPTCTLCSVCRVYVYRSIHSLRSECVASLGVRHCSKTLCSSLMTWTSASKCLVGLFTNICSELNSLACACAHARDRPVSDLKPMPGASFCLLYQS